MQKLLNSRELKSMLGISDSTLRKMINDGLPTIKYRMTNRYDFKSVIKWIKNYSKTHDNRGRVIPKVPSDPTN